MEKYDYIMKHISKTKFSELAGVSTKTLLKWERSEPIKTITERSIKQTINRLYNAMRWDV